MLRRNAVSAIALAVVATFLGASSAEAATPKAACYNAWIATQGLLYQVNQQLGQGPEFEGAFYANNSAYLAFQEAFDVERGVRGASLYEVRDHLDDALLELYYLTQMNLPADIAQKLKSATWYANYARKVVNSNIVD